MCQLFQSTVDIDWWNNIGVDGIFRQVIAVYGRASMGESWLLYYYRYAIRILAAFRQLSTHGQKFDPESLNEPI